MTQKNQNPTGFALLLSVIILSTILLTIFIMSNIFRNEIHTSYDIKKTMQAIYAAETGIERALWEIYKNDQTSLNNIEDSLDDNTTYSVNGEKDSKKLYILSSGKNYQNQRSLEVDIGFAYYSGPIQFEADIDFSDYEPDQCTGSECENRDWKASNVSGDVTCQNKAYWQNQNLTIIEQETDTYADCTIGNGQSFSVPTEMLTEEPEDYYLAVRARYSTNTGEKFSVSENNTTQNKNIQTSTDLYNDDGDRFITCVFQNTFTLNNISSLTFTGNSEPISLDWFALYSEKPQGLVSCNNENTT